MYRGRNLNNIIEDIENLVARNKSDFEYFRQAEEIVRDGGDALVDEEFFNPEDFEEVLQLRNEYLNFGNKPVGKKRKPVRKPNYQSLEQITETQGLDSVSEETRMAGDAFLDDLFQEAAEEKRQTQYLAKQLGRFANIDSQFERAGVPHQVVQDLQVSRQLSNGVPAPYIDTASKPGIERRVHTAVTQNPYTGELEIKAFNNPETGEALVTEFGDGRTGRIDGIEISNNPRKVGDRASELLGKHIMWLKGDTGARIAVDEKNYARPDLDVDGRGVDVHTLRTGVHDGVVEVQVNTGVNPRIKPRGNQEIAVQQMINAEMQKGKNMFEAIESLKNMDRGGLEPIRAPHWAPNAGEDQSAGKLVKEGYDGLVAPLFNWREARENVATKAGRGGRPLPKNQQDKQVLKPNKIFEVDLNEVRDAINKMTPAEQNRLIKVTPNAGNGGDGMHRSRINVNLPVDSPGVVDISNQGYVAQLLRQLNYA